MNSSVSRGYFVTFVAIQDKGEFITHVLINSEQPTL